MIFQIHPNLDVLETLQTVSPIWGFSETKMMRHHHFHYWDCHFLIVVAAFSATNAPIYRLPQLPHVHMCLQCTVDVSAVPKTSLSCRGLGDHGDPPNEGFNFFQPLKILDDVNRYMCSDQEIWMMSMVSPEKMPMIHPDGSGHGTSGPIFHVIQVEMGRNPMENPGKSDPCDPCCPRLPWFLP